MAFISSCPKCQQQVLVPDGTYPDAVVKCPVCSGEYSMGEILAAVRRRIVVHPGSAPATVTRALTTVESAGTAIATVADSGPLLFDGDRVELGTPDYGHAEPFGSHDAEQEAAAVLFGGEEGGHAAEDLAEPLTEEGHDLAAAAEGDAPWAGPGADSRTKPRRVNPVRRIRRRGSRLRRPGRAGAGRGPCERRLRRDYRQGSAGLGGPRAWARGKSPSSPSRKRNASGKRIWSSALSASLSRVSWRWPVCSPLHGGGECRSTSCRPGSISISRRRPAPAPMCRSPSGRPPACQPPNTGCQCESGQP